MSTRRRATFGMLAGDVPQAPPTTDPEKMAKADFWRTMADTARRRGDANDYQFAAAMLGGGSNGNGQAPQPPLPQPATVQDTISLSREAREAAAEQSRIALETASQEHERRVEAEQEAANAYSAGASSAADKWGTLLGIVQENNKTILEMQRESSDSRATTLQEQNKAMLERLEEKLTQAMSFKDIEIQRQEARAADAERRYQEQKGEHETLMRALFDGDDNHFAVKYFKRVHGQPTEGETYEQKKQNLDIKLKEAHVDKTVRGWGSEEDERRRKAEADAERQKTVMQWGERLVGAAESFLGSGTKQVPQAKWPEEVSLD